MGTTSCVTDGWNLWLSVVNRGLCDWWFPGAYQYELGVSYVSTSRKNPLCNIMCLLIVFVDLALVHFLLPVMNLFADDY